MTITGQCHCGAITYRAEGPPIKSSICDCLGCQRATGTLQAPFVTVRQAGFEITAGQPQRFKRDSGEMCDHYGAWHYCPRCGGPLYWQGDGSDEIDLFAGTLDDRSVFQPGP